MIHRLRTLTFLIGLLLLLSSSTLAQSTLHTYAARMESSDPDASPKPLFVAIVDAYSTADVAHDRSTGILTITTSFILDQGWLSSMSTDAGFRMTGLWLNGADIFWREVSVDEAAGMAPAPSATESNTQNNEH